jgi:hypothetical protein
MERSTWASPEQYLTERSEPISSDGSFAAVRTSHMLDGANDVDSTGKGTIGAFGNGSAAGFVARAACLEPDDAAGAGGAAGGAFGASGGTAGFEAAGCTGAAARFVRGRSHFSQRIPCEICVPHITH